MRLSCLIFGQWKDRGPCFRLSSAHAQHDLTMLRRMVIPTASSSPAGPPSSGMYATSSRSASAPRACVTPQSPSPTLGSGMQGLGLGVYGVRVWDLEFRV